MIRLLIIADDFTGALDTGVQFAACGASTQVVTKPSAAFDCFDTCDVLVVDAETRHLPASQAYDIVHKIVEQAKAASVPYIYKKTDSALRGNIGAELTALLDASGAGQLSFLPAFPQMGRTTEQGIHYIDGVPVADSVFGRDPFEPVKHSNVAQLIARQSTVPVRSCCAPVEDCDPGICVYDARTLQDLAETGQQLLRSGKLAVMAGCAGFGAVLPDLLELRSKDTCRLPRLDPNFLLICGSVNPITTAQVALAEENGFRRVQLAPRQKLDVNYWMTDEGARAFESLRRLLQEHPFRIIDTNDADGSRATADYAAARGMTIEDVRQAVSRTIGYLVGRLFPEPSLGTLMITGGDTLLQCMNEMEVYEIEPVCEMTTGVVLSRFRYQGFSRYVISKSGGFGDKDLLLELAQKISDSPTKKNFGGN